MDYTIYYYYDSTGIRGMEYNGVSYTFLKNLQGDVVYIVNGNGQAVTEYKYSPYGEVESITGTLASTVGQANPFRYRGYYMDTETGFYLTGARYYDPVVGRFINADGQLNGSQGVLGYNMFAYCLNNPVNMSDPNGTKPGDLFDSMDGAARDAAEYLGELSWENGWEYGTSIYTTTVKESRTRYVPTGRFFLNFSWSKGFFIDFKITGYKKETYKVKVTKYTYKSVKTNKKNNTTSVGSAPLFKKRVAALHTHPMGSWAGITRSSQGDIDWVAHYNIPLYVHGPNGELKRRDPGATDDVLVFSDLPISPKTPWLD